MGAGDTVIVSPVPGPVRRPVKGAVRRSVGAVRRFQAGNVPRLMILVVLVGYGVYRWGGIMPKSPKAVVTPTVRAVRPGVRSSESQTWIVHATPVYADSGRGQWVGWTVPIQTFTPVPSSRVTASPARGTRAGPPSGGVLHVVSPIVPTGTPFVGLCVPPSCVWVTPSP